MEQPAQPDPQSAGAYRSGYRDGFRDGFKEHAASTDDKQDGDRQDGAKKDEDKKDEDEKNGDEKDGDGKPPLYRRPALVGGALVLLLVVLIAGILFWRHASHHETTDDAFIDGHTSQVASQTAGRVTRLYVTDNQLVHAGDPLVDIDSRDTDTRIAEARAQLANAQGQVEEADAQVIVRRASAAEADATVRQDEADLTKAIQDLVRYQAVDPRAVPRQQVDAAEANERNARAKVDAARASARSAHAQIEVALAQVRAGRDQVDAQRANLDAAEVQGTYSRVVAPITGRVARRTVEAGNVISTGQALMALVGEDLWVTANFKETQLTRMRPGEEVDLVVDAYPDLTFHGRVDSIQRASGAYFSMLPAENATGNYVKVVQRVPVKIVFDDDRIRNYAIGPGMSVAPDVTLP